MSGKHFCNNSIIFRRKLLDILMSPCIWETKLAENVRKKRNIWIVKTFCVGCRQSGHGTCNNTITQPWQITYLHFYFNSNKTPKLENYT